MENPLIRKFFKFEFQFSLSLVKIIIKIGLQLIKKKVKHNFMFDIPSHPNNLDVIRVVNCSKDFKNVDYI